MCEARGIADAGVVVAGAGGVTMIIRRRSRSESIEAAGTVVTLVASTWTVAVGGRRGGIGWSYRRPSRVELDGRRTDRRLVPDPVVLARLTGIVVLAAASLAKRLTRRICHDR